MREIFPRDKGGGYYPLTFTKDSVPATFQLDGELQGSEKITFLLRGINGTDTIPWVDKETGEAIELTAENVAPIPVFSPLDLLMVKTTTLGDVGLKLVG